MGASRLELVLFYRWWCIIEQFWYYTCDCPGVEFYLLLISSCFGGLKGILLEAKTNKIYLDLFLILFLSMCFAVSLNSHWCVWVSDEWMLRIVGKGTWLTNAALKLWGLTDCMRWLVIYSMTGGVMLLWSLFFSLVLPLFFYLGL